MATHELNLMHKDTVVARVVYDDTHKKEAYIKFCEELGLRDGTETIQSFDYLVGNSDRHLQNIGCIRDPNTLEIKCVAPCYDTGNCMGYDYCNHRAVNNQISKLYDDDYEVVLKRINNFDWFKNSNVQLRDIFNLYKEVANGKLDNRVINEVLQEMTRRYSRLQQIVREKDMMANLEQKIKQKENYAEEER